MINREYVMSDILRKAWSRKDQNHPNPPGEEEIRQAVQLLANATINGDLNLEKLEHMIIAECVDMTRGHVTLTAQKLGIGRSTLYRKIEEIEKLDREASINKMEGNPEGSETGENLQGQAYNIKVTFG
jgi:DNA-binding NtrC family response regulator